ncbi:MAG: AAA domain-containing protein, partial [Bdellovibrio sp.]
MGKIEVLISGGKLLDDENLKEVFLFKSCTTQFTKILMRRLGETSNAEKVLGTSYYKMKMHDRNFREIYESLNPAQRGAVDYLVGNNLNGAIQGPPGTGKTQLLRAVITLALNSNMKVYLTSFTNAAVDNLLSRVVSDDFPHSWARVGGSDKIRTDLYDQNLQQDIARAGSFHEAQDVQLIGATLHKIAYSSSLPGIDLLVIDEAGQVPIYFWPFIERLARRVVLVGDQFQLPPVLGAVHENLPATNIFSHVIHKDTPMLEMQYRMRREIQAWSSEKFYKGKLTPHSSVAEQDYFAYSPAFVTDGFVVPK